MTVVPRTAALTVTAVLLVGGPLAGQVTGEEASARPSIVGGHIVDHETGRAVAGATVSLSTRPGDAAQHMVRTSDDEGRFAFPNVPPGSHALTVAALGYHDFGDVLEIEGDTDVRLVIRLSASPLRLDPLVVVTARRPAYMDGFEERRARDRVHTAFFTADEIEEQNPNVLSDLFAAVPGAYLEPGLMSGNPLGNVLRVQGVPGASAIRGCLPDVWVNGFLADGLPFDEMFPPDQIEAIELYTIRHDVPARFVGPRGCGALVIWARERAPDKPFLPTWKRWILVLGALGATILLAR